MRSAHISAIPPALAALKVMVENIYEFCGRKPKKSHHHCYGKLKKNAYKYVRNLGMECVDAIALESSEFHINNYI